MESLIMKVVKSFLFDKEDLMSQIKVSRNGIEILEWLWINQGNIKDDDFNKILESLTKKLNSAGIKKFFINNAPDSLFDSLTKTQKNELLNIFYLKGFKFKDLEKIHYGVELDEG